MPSASLPNQVEHKPAEAARVPHADAPEDSELGLSPLETAEAAGLSRRERHIREGLQAILGEGAERQRELRERTQGPVVT